MRRIAAATGIAVVAVGLAGAAAASLQPVIPWLAQRPVRASAQPPLAPPCRAGGLRAQLFLQGATGSLVGGVNLTNTGSRPCSLLGWPSPSFTGAAAAAASWQVRKLARSPQPLDVLADPPGSLRALAPGKTAGVAVFWSNWCGPGAQPTGSPGAIPAALALRLPGGTSVAVPLSRAPRCDDPASPSLLSLGPFTPATRQLPQSSRLPLAVAIVGARPVRVKPGVYAFRAHRGEILRYEVAATNTGGRPFRFAPTSCPVYVEQLVPGPQEAYVLNCRPAGTIAPHRRVLFAMQIRVPAHARRGNTGLGWQLAPRTFEAPFTSAAVWVLP